MTILFMARRTTSIKIDDALWIAVKHHCIDANMDISEYLERFIRKDLRK